MKKIILFSVCSFFFSLSSFSQIVIPANVEALLKKHTCVSCHKAEKKSIGPSWEDIAQKKYDKKTIIVLVHEPIPSNWPGFTPMAALPNVPKADIGKIAIWIKTLEKKD